MNCALDDVANLYHKYEYELSELCRCLRSIYHGLLNRGVGTAFSDVEGELVYMLIRETRPSLVFEMSPDCGWSTNYILAGLTANEHGVVHSFELEPTKHGIPVETMIRSNLSAYADQSRLVFHLGDAREKVPAWPGDIDFLFVDSCHEDWFAEWYVSRVFPRVNGWVFVHDIAFTDGLEPSTEAAFVWDWIRDGNMKAHLVGRIEMDPRIRAARQYFAERRNAQSNGILFSLPVQEMGSLPTLDVSPDSLLDLADSATPAQADGRLNSVVRSTTFQTPRSTCHRVLFRAATIRLGMGEPDEARRTYFKALAALLGANAVVRGKGLNELFIASLGRREWRWALTACSLLFLTVPRGFRLALATIRDKLKSRLDKRFGARKPQGVA